MKDRNNVPDDRTEQARSADKSAKNNELNSPFRESSDNNQQQESPEEQAAEEQQRKEALTERD